MWTTSTRPRSATTAAKQLSHFVHPGAQRIAAESNSPNLLVSALRSGATNTNELIVGGRQDRWPPVPVRVELPDVKPFPAAWELYETTRQIDCLKVDTIPVTGGAAEFD